MITPHTPYKSYNEKLEKKVWKMVLDNCEKQQLLRNDTNEPVEGMFVYYVRDLSLLVASIMEFNENETGNVKRATR